MSSAKHVIPSPDACRTLKASGSDVVRFSPRPCDALGLAAAALGALLLCAPARGQEAAGGEAIGSLMDALHLRETPRPPADFVLRSRPDPERLDYHPLADKPAPTKKKTAAELDALTATLESARARNQRAARNIKALDAPARGAVR